MYIYVCVVCNGILFSFSFVIGCQRHCALASNSFMHWKTLWIYLNMYKMQFSTPKRNAQSQTGEKRDDNRFSLLKHDVRSLGSFSIWLLLHRRKTTYGKWWVYVWTKGWEIWVKKRWKCLSSSSLWKIEGRVRTFFSAKACINIDSI